MKSPVITKEENKKQQLTPASKETLPFHSLQQEMNRLFEEFKSNLGWTQPTDDHLTSFHLKSDVKDNETKIVVSTELPGVDLKDLDVSVQGNFLVMKGEKKEEKEEKEKGYYRMERSFGSFYRSIPLPCEIEQENVEAVYKDGVLTVTLPKCKESIKKDKTITVKAG